MNKIETIIEYSRNRIQKRMYLKVKPDIAVRIRNIVGPNSKGQYKIEPSQWNVIEPSEFWREEGYFNGIQESLEEEYPQLFKDRDRKVPFSAYLIEPIVSFGSSAMTISGGLNWVVMGVLKNGEKYCAILDVEVRPLLRRCGLMTLLKHVEIELAKREKCDFIHTWHSSDNPDFNAAIVPGLKSGFILYHGPIKDGEDYEDRGCVHLRYYFNRTKRRNVRVSFKDDKEFISPGDNDGIINYLENCPDKYPGTTISKIEEYGKTNTKLIKGKTKRITENVRGKSSKQRVFIAEGAVGFEYTRQRNTYRIGDVLSFCPCVLIDHYVKSNEDAPYMNHVINNIYEFQFKPISVIQVKQSGGAARQDYVLEILPGLRLLYTGREMNKKHCLKADQWYKGYGRLFICDHRDSLNGKASKHVKELVAKGKLVGILNDQLQDDFSHKYANQVKQFRYGKDVYCPEDALEWFGYYKDIDEFKKSVATYLENPVELESTDSPEAVGYSHNLIFCIDVMV
ncbi:MAG: hypothetical protein NT140_05735 [Deltaproteobacteria bacterium]|nr:hypothetical protein [Deltaproteobacteria bacterium]